jgi:hypothetical protein
MATRRLEELPMSHVQWCLRIAEDSRYTSPTIRTAIYLARHAEDTGVVGTDPDGRPLAEPRSVAAALELGESTVFKALTALDRDGVIEWDKATTMERFAGITGRVRLILSDKSE